MSCGAQCQLLECTALPCCFPGGWLLPPFAPTALRPPWGFLSCHCSSRAQGSANLSLASLQSSSQCLQVKISARKMMIHCVSGAVAAPLDQDSALCSGESQTLARLIYIFCQHAGKEPLGIFSAHVKSPHVILIPALKFQNTSNLLSYLIFLNKKCLHIHCHGDRKIEIKTRKKFP